MDSNANAAPKGMHSALVQANLDAVSARLALPTHLSGLTPSRLPSSAVTDESVHSPTSAARSSAGAQPHNDASTDNDNDCAIESSSSDTDEDEFNVADLLAPLIQEPDADGHFAEINPAVAKHLEESIVETQTEAASRMAAPREIQPYDAGHDDLVLAVSFNYYGNRMATAGSDHRIKVWDKKDDQWKFVDGWKAHDAEVTDVSIYCHDRTCG